MAGRAGSQLYRVYRGVTKPKKGDDNGAAQIGDFTTVEKATKAAKAHPRVDANERYWLEPLTFNGDTRKDDWVAEEIAVGSEIVYLNAGPIVEMDL